MEKAKGKFEIGSYLAVLYLYLLIHETSFEFVSSISTRLVCDPVYIVGRITLARLGLLK